MTEMTRDAQIAWAENRDEDFRLGHIRTFNPDYHSAMARAIAARLKADGEEIERIGELRIVFDGPPGPESGRFVEVETPDGKSVNAGEWHWRSDGLWELRIRAALKE